METVSRRSFMKGTAAAGIGALAASSTAWAGANDRLRVACIGLRGRGNEHIEQFSTLPNVEIATLCDIDEKILDQRKNYFKEKNLKIPKTETDLRKVFDDKDIDAVSIATPNHWHALATIWACQAGKDVYVEKPASHNVFEGRKMVEAAAKYGRVVQVGTQIRSNPSIQEAIKHLQDGLLGEVYLARGLCYKRRPSIGKKPDSDIPKGVNYDIWVGPAPMRPFNENRFHYNWHWMWDTGNGDIGNQGVHQMDIARWGLGVKLPKKIAGMGSMFLWDDDKEVPNTTTTSFFYPDEGPKGKMLEFEVRPWHTNDEKGAKIGILFYGEKGYMVIDSYSNYKTYLGEKEEPGPSGDVGANHFENFLQAVRERKPELLNAPIEEGHYSAALAHLGLISVRVGRALDFDPATEQIIGDDEAAQYLTRKYREPYVVPETV
ncbi:MAG: Gfo/Idh/MocA family oxidoreductase [Candidatus Hydrogenedentes bacterium]|nr:Gfo/Idh/MocA family oxidoreductase [Candidatus Hydrogenedentota bacterium]